MIEQDLNIAILEMFDEVKKLAIFKNYRINEEKALNNIEVKHLVSEINKLSDLTYSITYQPSLDEICNKIDKLTLELENNEFYNNYLCSYNECNEYINYLSKIIFKDIIEVERECFCDH